MGDDRSLPRMAMAFGCALQHFDSFSKLGRRVNFRKVGFSDLIKSTNCKLLLLSFPKILANLSLSNDNIFEQALTVFCYGSEIHLT